MKKTVKKKGVSKKSFRDVGKQEITIGKLIYYNVLFFMPIIAFWALSKVIAPYLSKILEISEHMATRMMMIFLTLLIFLIVIPYIRKRENITGVRYALTGFLIVGVFIAVPPILKGNFDPILNNLIYIASYILLTFIYCPEVLGIDQDIHKYFERSRQLIVILVYITIVLFYVLGFGNLYYQLYLENNEAYNFSYEEDATLSTFAYYSMITFTTIGYGEIVPATNGARLLATIEAVLGMIINIIFIAILFMYISNIQSWMQKEESELSKEEKQIKKEQREIKKLKEEVEKKRKKK